MDVLQTRIEALLHDARRAAVPGSIGDDPDRGGVLFADTFDHLRMPPVPSASALSVAIDGKGFFVADAGDGRRAYTRRGAFHIKDAMLVDEAGRPVLGLGPNTPADAAGKGLRLEPIRVDGCTDVTIASDGAVSGNRNGARRLLGRIALAVFPAPDRLERLDETSVRATRAAGTVCIVRPGSPNAGTLVDHALDDSGVALDADLERIWRLEQQSDARAASEYAADQCDRDALGLVK